MAGCSTAWIRSALPPRRSFTSSTTFSHVDGGSDDPDRRARSLAEGCLFFVVADVPISLIGLRRGAWPAMIAALVAAPMAALGGLGIALATRAAPDSVHRLLVHIPGISDRLLAVAHSDWAQRGFAAMLGGSFSGVPYKRLCPRRHIARLAAWRAVPAVDRRAPATFPDGCVHLRPDRKMAARLAQGLVT